MLLALWKRLRSRPRRGFEPRSTRKRSSRGRSHPRTGHRSTISSLRYDRASAWALNGANELSINFGGTSEQIGAHDECWHRPFTTYPSSSREMGPDLDWWVAPPIIPDS